MSNAKIVSHVPNGNYREGFDRIFGKGFKAGEMQVICAASNVGKTCLDDTGAVTDTVRSIPLDDSVRMPGVLVE